jgi:hypothetical protein
MPTEKLLHLLVGTTIAAIGKELRDMRGHGTPEVLDAAATIAGGGLLLGWFEIANGNPFI